MDFAYSHILRGFDLDLVGFDCAAELDFTEAPRCPFKPGCGKTPGPECPLMRQLATIIRPPPRWQ